MAASRVHPIDRAAGVLYDLGWSRAFADGWGDERLVAFLGASVPDEPAPVEPVVGEPRRVGDLLFADGSFPSPCPELPGPSRVARFVQVTPTDGSNRAVVLLAAWGEHGYLRRLSLARRLAAGGVSSIVLENPFYGSRRPHPDPVIRSVADFALMGWAAVAEARSLMAWLSQRGEVGVAGFSMGGNTAALAGASMPIPVAIAPLAPSPSPGPVWMEGVISRSVTWSALGADGRRRLAGALGSASVLSIAARPHTGHAVLVGAVADGYVPRQATLALHAHWPGSELRWVEAGHGTLIWRHKAALARAILDSLARVAAAG